MSGSRGRSSMRMVSWIVPVLAVVVGACSGGGGSHSTARSTTSGVGATASWVPASGVVALSADPAWRMHPITARLRLNNGLGTALLDGDGRTDFTTAEEGDSRYAIVLSGSGDPRRSSSWRTIEVLPNATSRRAGPGKPPAIALEYTTFADVDGDGRPDLLGAQGSELGEGDEPGIRVFWGPAAASVANPAAWQDAGRIPSTIGRGHWERVEATDLNGDGAKDLLVGGRTDYLTERNAGIGWIAAPEREAGRRDLARWRLHMIDPTQPGGYGFAVADVNGDGRPDVVLANSDSDTSPAQRAIVWYRNPGPGAIDRPWPKQVIERLPDLGRKTQVAIGDLGDRRASIVTATPGKVHIYESDGRTNPKFSKIVLTLPTALSGPHERMVKLADVDGDGRLDLLLGFEHDDHAALRADRAAVAWLGQTSAPRAPWVAHVIRWGAGRTMQIASFGEKWQVGFPEDVNGDGRTDLVMDDQEWWVDPNGEFGDWTTPDPRLESVGIVWFEHPNPKDATACDERSGTCTLEAESPSTQHDGTWVERDVAAGAGAYVQDFNALDTATRCNPAPRPNTSCADPAGGLAPGATLGDTYRMKLDGGTYAIWARVLDPSAWVTTAARKEGPAAAWVSIGRRDDPLVVPGRRDAWTWVKVTPSVRLPSGTSDLRLRVREGGIAVDRIAVTRNLANVPPSHG
jgi:hypothetical protein